MTIILGLGCIVLILCILINQWNASGVQKKISLQSSIDGTPPRFH